MRAENHRDRHQPPLPPPPAVLPRNSSPEQGWCASPGLCSCAVLDEAARWESGIHARKSKSQGRRYRLYVRKIALFISVRKMTQAPLVNEAAGQRAWLRWQSSFPFSVESAAQRAGLRGLYCSCWGRGNGRAEGCSGSRDLAFHCQGREDPLQTPSFRCLLLGRS